MSYDRFGRTPDQAKKDTIDSYIILGFTIFLLLVIGYVVFGM